jgi:hypothetical protein
LRPQWRRDDEKKEPAQEENFDDPVFNQRHMRDLLGQSMSLSVVARDRRAEPRQAAALSARQSNHGCTLIVE